MATYNSRYADTYDWAEIKMAKHLLLLQTLLLGRKALYDDINNLVFIIPCFTALHAQPLFYFLCISLQVHVRT